MSGLIDRALAAVARAAMYLMCAKCQKTTAAYLWIMYGLRSKKGADEEKPEVIG